MKAKIILALVALSIGTLATSQTILKDIPIESDWPYLVKVWAWNPEIEQHNWYEITETGDPGAVEWYIERQVSCHVDPGMKLHALFITGNQECADTTILIVHGALEKTIIKDKKDLRKRIQINGSIHQFGPAYKEPEIITKTN